jgi:hypothetical protein
MSLIRLGSLAGYSFEGPYTLGGWKAPSKPGVYAIMYKADPEGKPNAFSVIYVGYAMDLSKAGLPKGHPQASCWAERSGGPWKLYIATYPVPKSQSIEGTMYQISLELIAKYQPRCNEEKYDRAWDNRWVGDYTSSLTAPLRPRGPHEDPI